jgi:hypothetical protein
MERFAARRRQEDDAPRLHDVVPTLTSCRIVIEQGRPDSTTADVTHTRRIVVEHAPALLIVPCSDSSCREGGHDISAQLLRGLREGRTEVKGEDVCHGHVGTATCGRVLRFTAHAEYRKPA